jgi:hypothetical protein
MKYDFNLIKTINHNTSKSKNKHVYKITRFLEILDLS